MRRFLMAVAVAAAAFTLTAAGAGTAGLIGSTSVKSIGLKSLARQTVTMTDCKATGAVIDYGFVTDETSADYGKVNQVTVRVSHGSSDINLDDCNYAQVKIDGTNYETPRTFAAVTGNGPYYRTATFPIVATATIATDVIAIITPNNPV